MEAAIIVGALLSLIGAGVGLYSSNKTNKDNQAFANQQMALQQQYNEQNMAKQDEYQRGLIQDSPSLQKQGMLNAGLNPNLITGSPVIGNSDTNGGMPSSSYTGFNPFDSAMQGSQMGMAMMQQSAQLDNLKADTKLKLKNADKFSAETNTINEMLDPSVQYLKEQIKALHFDFTQFKPNQMKLNDSNITLIDKRIDEISSNIGLNIANTKLSNEQRREVAMNVKVLMQQVANMVQELKESRSRIRLNESAINLNYASAYNQRQQGFSETYNRFLTKVEAQNRNFELKVKKSLGPGYYTNRQILDDISGNVKSLAETVGVGIIAGRMAFGGAKPIKGFSLK